MKSKFAKFVDGTLGAVLIFAAATAVLRYYTTMELAAFSAAAVTACILFMLRFIGKRKDGERYLSSRTADMFYDFMFEDDRSPARRLCDGLKSRGENAVLHGSGVYLGKTAAFCLFDAPPDSKAVARIIARARHYGATKVVVLSKAAPTSTVAVKGVTVKPVIGDDVYKLFASLGCLPDRRFEKPASVRFAALRGALAKDRIVRYLVLSAVLFAATPVIYSPVTVACAFTAAALFIAACAYNIVIAIRSKRPHKRDDGSL